MSYQKKTIKTVLDEINSGQVYLPAIQRKYVWSENQITKLMDSIMLNYPIGTFLFWKVSKEIINSKQYSLYEFIKNYHERDFFSNLHAPNPITKDTIFAVLDGQQRLTSLFIALQGSLALKLPMKRWSSSDAFPVKELYLNLKSQKSSEDDDITYKFAFLTEEQANNTSENTLWFKAKKILEFETTDDVMEYIAENTTLNNSIIRKNLLALHRCLVTEEIINYFEIKKDSLDDVLDIFIRVNSGGTVLSKTDLLFSTVVSHWDKARDEIENLLKTINNIGEKYKFTNDFIMRSCLYFLDLPVTLKVEAFKQDSVMSIKDNWDNIKKAIINTVKLLNEFGFNSENIISYVAITPVAYYLYKDGLVNSATKFELRKYIVVAQLKQIFGTAGNSALSSIREVLKNSKKPFSLNLLESIRFTGDRTLKFSANEIDSLLDDLNIGAYTFMVLSLLYPNLKYSQKGFHQDHMHPYSAFDKKEVYQSLNLSSETLEEWRQLRNKLPNLQLLEGRENESKNATSLVEWLKDKSNSENAKYLPPNISYELSNFENFMEERKKLFATALKEILL